MEGNKDENEVIVKSRVGDKELVNNQTSLVKVYYNVKSTYDEDEVQEKVKKHVEKLKKNKNIPKISRQVFMDGETFEIDWNPLEHKIFVSQYINVTLDNQVSYYSHSSIEMAIIIHELLEAFEYDQEKYFEYLDSFENYEELYFSGEWVENYAKIQDDEETNIRNIESGVTGIWKCGKCGNDHILFRKKQVRSGDEGMTTFLRCSKCDYMWREE